uniref:Uncharacterized protein n=1 Tax=Moniliophthora roreri TaxID=221103 RepID=A0A0W0FKZ1_MONRR
MSAPLPTSPSALKKLEKQIVQEGKTEDASVKHALKDLAHVEKSAAKAEKAVDKMSHSVHKAIKKEDASVKALNKATHQHDVAVGKVSAAERDLQAEKQHSVRLQEEVDEKKARVEALIASQTQHKEAREARLAEIEQAKDGGDVSGSCTPL